MRYRFDPLNPLGLSQKPQSFPQNNQTIYTPGGFNPTRYYDKSEIDALLADFSPAGGGTPAGSNNEIQFNDGGVFGSSPNFTYSSTGFNAFLQEDTSSIILEAYNTAATAGSKITLTYDGSTELYNSSGTLRLMSDSSDVTLDFDGLTDNWVYQLPDASGTLALTSDVLWETHTYGAADYLEPKTTHGLVIANDLHSSVTTTFQGASAIFNGTPDGANGGVNYYGILAYGSGFTAFGALSVLGRAEGTPTAPTYLPDTGYVGAYTFGAFDGTDWVASGSNHVFPGLIASAAADVTGGVLEADVWMGGLLTKMIGFETDTNAIKFNEAQLDSDITFYNDTGTTLTLDGSTGDAVFNSGNVSIVSSDVGTIERRLLLANGDNTSTSSGVKWHMRASGAATDVGVQFLTDRGGGLGLDSSSLAISVSNSSGIQYALAIDGTDQKLWFGTGTSTATWDTSLYRYASNTLRGDNRLLLNTSSSVGYFHVGVDTAARVGIAITGAASQTADLLQIRDSSTNPLVAVSSNGRLVFGSTADVNLYRGGADLLRTSDALTVDSTLTASATIELGHATDTTLSRSAAGVLAVEGVAVPTISSTNTLTNKRITKRVEAASDATSITPTGDSYDITTQANTQALGTLTINAPTGTPTDGQELTLRIKSTNAHTYSFNAIYRGSLDTPLPTTHSGSSLTDYLKFIYNSADSKWDLIALSGGY